MRCLAAAIMVWLAVNPAGAAPDPVEFEGNTVFPRATLMRALRYYNVALKDAFDITDADDAAYFLREYYFDQGYPDAEVHYQFRRNPSSVVFQIKEGSRLWIGRVEFVGNTAITSDRLNDVLAAAIRQQTLSPFGRLRYVPVAFEPAVNDLRAVFVQEGYLDTTIEIIEGNPINDAVPLTVMIHEGPQYQLTDVDFDGAGFPEKEILEALQIRLPQTYRPADLALIRSRLIDFLRNRGHFSAEVSGMMAKDQEKGEIHLLFDVDPGASHTLSEIQVEGTSRTREKAALGKFGLRTGQVYNAARVEEAAQRLWFTGAFADVETKVDILDDNRLKLTLRLAEGRARQIRAFAGYGQWERGFGEVSLIDRNFLGTLNRFELNGYVSSRGFSVDSTLYNPWFLGAHVTGLVGAFVSRREYPAYRATQYGGLVGIERRQDVQKLTGFQLQYIWRAVTNSQVFGDEEADQNYTVGGISFRHAWDKRNDMLAPMKGFLLQHDLALASRALLGDLSFVRAAGQMTFYFPFRAITPERPFVPFLVLNQRAGVILPYADTAEVPVQERFFLGGPDTVRSFPYDGLGPQDKDGDPLGGQAYLQGNIEVQVPVIRSIYIATFVDIGNLAPEFMDLAWDETAVGAGAGLRLYTPIGALRVDYGYNVIRRTGYPIGAWQFGFGFTF